MSTFSLNFLSQQLSCASSQKVFYREEDSKWAEYQLSQPDSRVSVTGSDLK